VPDGLRAIAYRTVYAFGISLYLHQRFSADLARPVMLSHLLYGAIRLPLWGYVAFTFAMVQLMFLGVTLYLHRDQSHGGLVLHPALRHFFRFWLWF